MMNIGNAFLGPACARPWPDMHTAITEGIEKLAAHGSPQQMRDYLVENGITGLAKAPDQCVVAEYLIQSGYVGRGEIHVSRTASSACCVEPNCEPSKTTVRTTGAIFHPDAITELIIGFDNGDYPELVRQ